MSKIKIILLLLFIGIGQSIFAQKYFTRSGNIAFFSEAPLEKIEAKNQKASSVLDASSGKMEFAVLIKAFQFDKALMQEHFNENYMESSKYPKAKFKGQIQNMDDINFLQDGKYTAQVKGDLTIHGETKEVEIPAQFTLDQGALQAFAQFEVSVADYGIEIPKVVRENIAKSILITVDVNYELLKPAPQANKND